MGNPRVSRHGAVPPWPVARGHTRRPARASLAARRAESALRRLRPSARAAAIRPARPFLAPDGLAARVLGDWVAELSLPTLRADGLAGLLGAVLVLPQAIAYASLAGLPPEYGLYTAVLPVIVAALAGSSRHVVSGPTNANSLALFAMLTPLAVAGSADYIQLALVVTLLVGVLQLAVGALRLGAVANFVSPSVLLGFTTGAALLIGLHALKDVLGLGGPARHDLVSTLAYLAHHLAETSWAAVAIAAITLAVALGLRRRWPPSPHLLLGLVAGTLVSLALAAWWPAAGAVRTVGEIPSPWPSWSWPLVPLAELPQLIGIAFALSIVAMGQSISVAKLMSQQAGQRLDPNREFVGQGLSNLVGGLSSSYVSCGSFNRSLPSLQSGARTPLAAVFSALWLLALVAASAGALARVPSAAIGALLVLVAASLVDLRRWRRLARLARDECAIAAVTALATVTMRMEIAIVLGTLLSLVAYLYRTARPAMRTMGFDDPRPERPFIVVEDTPGAYAECPQLKLLRMEGSVYFGAVQHVADRLHQLRETPDAAHAPKHLLVMAKSMNFIDLAGADLWDAEMATRRARGGDLYFHRPRPPVIETWERTGFLDRLGRDHLFPDKRRAISTIFGRLDRSVCAGCTVRVFHECQWLPRPVDAEGRPLAMRGAPAPAARAAGAAAEDD